MTRGVAHVIARGVRRLEQLEARVRARQKARLQQTLFVLARGIAIEHDSRADTDHAARAIGIHDERADRDRQTKSPRVSSQPIAPV